MHSTLPTQSKSQGMREITLGQAIRETLAEEMRRDPSIFILGEDVAEAGTAFKVLGGLVEEFRTERVIDTPISEQGITGMGVGAAMTGMRPSAVEWRNVSVSVKPSMPGISTSATTRSIASSWRIRHA